MSSFVTWAIIKPEKVGETYFSSYLFSLIMVRHISIFNIFISNFFTLCTLFDELVSFERVNEKINIEVNILRKQHAFLFKKKDFICYRSRRI